MGCFQCVYYRHERDTNYKYCTKDKEGDNNDFPNIECDECYYIADAKADAKYRDCDKY